MEGGALVTEPAEGPVWQRLTPLLSHPLRFSLVAALAAADSLDFRDLRGATQTTDSTLSKQLRTLEDAGIVEIRKSFVGKYPRTSARLTAGGRKAWAVHLGALREIVDEAGTGGDA